MKRTLYCLVGLLMTPLAHAESCGGAPIQLQILGSSAAQLVEGRANAGVLLWINGKARALVDIGPGTVLRFSQTGATANDLDVALFTQLRSERSADLPALVQLMMNAPRVRVLPIYGPADNRVMPSTVSFVRALFDPTRGAWRHLGDALNPLARSSFKLDPHDVRPTPARLGRANEKPGLVNAFSNDRLRTKAMPIVVGQMPALVWSLETAGKRVVISPELDDVNALFSAMKEVDVLIVPLSSARNAQTIAWARTAQVAGVKQILLAPREPMTPEQTEQLMTIVQKHFTRPVSVANDLDCVTP